MNGFDYDDEDEEEKEFSVAA